MITPIGDLYYARRLEHTGKRGSLLLPDSAKEDYFDAEILACGPGRVNDKGETVAMQAAVGDRILCDPAAFQHYEPGNTKPTCGFVRDRNILAVVRAPDHAAVEPAADWLLVDPDPRDQVEDGVAFSEKTESGLLVVTNSLAGEDERRKERGYELLEDYQRLLESQRYREQPTAYDQSRLEQGFIEALSKPDYECFAPLLRKERQKRAARGPAASLLVGTQDDYRADAPVRLAPKLQTGRVLGIGPDARTDVELGERIRWSRFHTLVRLAVGGALRVLVPAGDAEAVLT